MNYTPEQWDALARRLNDGGCPVLRDHGYKISPVGLCLERLPGPNQNRIFSLAPGLTGFEFELVLRNDAERPIDVCGFQIKTPWGVPKLSLLPAPKKSSARYPNYCFPDPGPFYDGGFVLNPLFARRKSRVKPGEELDGVLVATSDEAIPERFQHLAWVITTLTVFDSRGNRYSGQFSVRIIRWEGMARESADRVREAQEREHESLESAAVRLPHPLVAPPAPKERSEHEKQELAEMWQRFCEDITAASERHHARMALESNSSSDEHPTADAGIEAATVGRD